VGVIILTVVIPLAILLGIWAGFLPRCATNRYYSSSFGLSHNIHSWWHAISDV